VTNCFGCKKKLGVFSERGVKKWIIKNGGKPPEGMDDKDVLCHDCLELIREQNKVVVLLRKSLKKKKRRLEKVFHRVQKNSSSSQ